MDAQNWVAMGYVKGAFGIKGWLKVKADTEYTDSLLDYPEWRLRRDRDVRTLALESGKVAGDELQVKFVGIDDRDAAALLRGYTVEIARADFAPAAEDEYYWADLVGMTVQNREGADLGKVVNLMDTGAHDVLVIEGGFGQKLIPFVSHYIDEVDGANRVITADWGVDY
ncbi:ribosome maturation factor RimM [Conchiformibius kuhniae]|uniref:Ribosome maturation factor RimM n=1 Tax=Conchiformibius kuhniae TaxID=211502 RepID=A0ABD8B6T9_9NEIS|nr:ribosome maturation factor RimM [Conchiformibius kuhniae]